MNRCLRPPPDGGRCASRCPRRRPRPRSRRCWGRGGGGRGGGRGGGGGGGGGGLQPDGDGAGGDDPVEIVDAARERELRQPEGGVDLAQADERDRHLEERRLTALAQLLLRAPIV